MFLMKCYTTLSAGSTCVLCVFKSSWADRCACSDLSRIHTKGNTVLNVYVCSCMCVLQRNRYTERDEEKKALIHLNECLLMFRFSCFDFMLLLFFFLLGLPHLVPVCPAEQLMSSFPSRLAIILARKP